MLLGDLLQQLEIDMGGDVGIAGVGEDIDLLVRLQCLQGRSGTQLHLPVINDQRRPALLLQAAGDLGHQRGRSRAGFDHRALCGAAPAGRDEVIHPLTARHEGEILAVQPDQSIEPAIGAAHQLVDRQGIEKFVGNDQQRRIVGQGRKIVVVVAVGEGLALKLPEACRGFDEVDLRRKIITPRRPQRILRQSAAAGPEFDVVDALATAHPHPQIGQPQPDQLAEHLADFRRSDEIALFTQRIAAGIVARVAFPHELREADGAGLADQPLQSGRNIDLRTGEHFGFQPGLFGSGRFFGLALGLFFGGDAGGFFFGSLSGRFCGSEPRRLGSGLGFTASLFLGCQPCSFFRLAPGSFFGFLLGLGFGLAARLGFGSEPRFLFGGSLGTGFGLSLGAGLGFGAGTRFGFLFQARFFGSAQPGIGFEASLFFGLAAGLFLGCGTGGGGSGLGLAAGTFLGLGPGAGFSLGAGLGFLARLRFGGSLGAGFGFSTRPGLSLGKLPCARFGSGLFAGFTLSLGAGLGFGLFTGACLFKGTGAFFRFGLGAGEAFRLFAGGLLGAGLGGGAGCFAGLGVGARPGLGLGTRLRGSGLGSASLSRAVWLGIDQPERAFPDTRAIGQADAVVPDASGFLSSAKITTINPVRISGMVSHCPIDSPVRTTKSASC